MELYNKKTNHDLLKELDKLTIKHTDLKLEILEHYDIYTRKLNELSDIENTYKTVYDILKARI